MLGQL